MTVPGRGNGLVASSYVVLADLTPQLADQMLDELRDAGVAAYATPLPAVASQLIDRLYVDRNAVNDAREVLRRRLPELLTAVRDGGDAVDLASSTESPRSADDEAWDAIVAAWDQPAADPVRHGVDDDDPNAAPRTVAATPPPSAPVPRPVPAEDHYVPPDPPPLPKADPLTRLAWIGVVSGPVFFLVTALLRIEVTGVAAFLGVTAFVAGFVTLVARMRERPAADDGPDDGAVV
jgi:hypothetical protein